MRNTGAGSSSSTADVVDPRLATERAAELLYLEAACLDERRWADWLALYTEDAEYWVPAWDSEHELTSDPTSEMSLIYYDGRAGLEDRVHRLETGTSGASLPLPRTCHLVTNVRVKSVDAQRMRVAACWLTRIYFQQKKRVDSFSGFYEHTLRREPDDRLRIEKKKIIVTNDLIPSVLDVWSV
jgi:3-phenylpropionate/cinnamic acid dioxygenase small subunit